MDGTAAGAVPGGLLSALRPGLPCQEALVPEHRQFALLLPEPQEVEDEGVKHMVGQSVLLIQQQSQEDAVGTTVFHLGDFQHGRTGVQHRDGALGDDATHDDGFPEGTGA